MTRAAGGRRKPTPEAARVHPQLALGDGHRHPARRAHRRPGDGLLGPRDWSATYGRTLERGALLAAHDRRDAGARLHDRATRARTRRWARLRAHRLCSIRSSARCSAGSAWRSPARTRRRTCCSAACRRSPPSSSASVPMLMAAANSSGGVMGKMIDAQSIVVASHRHQVVRPRGRHPALRVLPQPRARRADGGAGDAAGLRLAVHRAGGALIAPQSAKSHTRRACLRGRATSRRCAPLRRAGASSGFIPGDRLITDPLRLLAWGTDASFYRLVPKLAVVVESEDEVVRLLGRCARHAHAGHLPRRRHEPLGPGDHRLGAGAAGRQLARLRQSARTPRRSRCSRA